MGTSSKLALMGRSLLYRQDKFEVGICAFGYDIRKDSRRTPKLYSLIQPTPSREADLAGMFWHLKLKALWHPHDFPKSIQNANPLSDLSLTLISCSHFDRLNSIVDFDFLLPFLPLPPPCKVNLANNILKAEMLSSAQWA